MKKIVFVSLLLVQMMGMSLAQEMFNVDVMPANVGGKAEFKRVFDQQLIYPKTALARKIDGKVIVSFTVMKDSTIRDIVVTEKVSKELDAEAVRLLNYYMWVPAIKEGKYVSSKWSAAFHFDSGKYDKICKERGFREFKYLANIKVDTSLTVHKNAEQMPMYQKGTFALQDFIKENLEYPRQAQLSNIQGTVLLGFVVEPSGLPTNIGVLKSVGGGCDQEAVRILEMIKWYPAKNGETLVRAYMTFPIYFVLNEDFKDNSAGEQK